MSKFLKMLQNPFLLVGQGFMVGAAIFWTTHHGPPDLAAIATAGASVAEQFQAFF